MECRRGHCPHLTGRERDLIAQILAGRSNRAIADRLGIRPQTVRNQLTVLFRKLRVSSRLELAVRVSASEPSDLCKSLG